MSKARELALSALMRIFEDGEKSHLVIRSILDNSNELDKTERSFFTRLTEGSVERYLELEYIVSSYNKSKSGRVNAEIKMILIMSAYQILKMDGVSDYAAVNEGVELSKSIKGGRFSSFVNGVLRSIVRDKDNIKYPDESEDEVEYLSVKYSMPKWIVLKWKKDYGRDKLIALLKAHEAEDMGTFVRVRGRDKRGNAVSYEDTLNALKSEAAAVETAAGSTALCISGYNKLSELTAFKEGMIYPQDISSMLVALIAAPKKNEVIIDTCSAPGGKSLHMADIAPESEIHSFDVSDAKVKLINDNIRYYGVTNIQAEVSDGRVFNEKYESKADCLVCDVPCSGMGVMRRKTDIRYKLNQINIKELTELQREIVANSVRYLKAGGRLIYSTCTVNRNENDKNVKWICDNLGFEIEDVRGYVPEKFKGLVSDEGMLQVFTGDNGADGFFIARLRKV